MTSEKASVFRRQVEELMEDKSWQVAYCDNCVKCANLVQRSDGCVKCTQMKKHEFASAKFIPRRKFTHFKWLTRTEGAVCLSYVHAFSWGEEELEVKT